MTARPHSTVLFSSPLIRIEDVRCRSTRAAVEGEERSPRPGVAIVRSGVFRKHLGRREVLADWNHAILFNAGESYRVSHPLEGGDDCTFHTFGEELLSEVLTTLGHSVGTRSTPTFPLTHTLLPTSALLLDLELRRLCRTGGADPIAVETLALEVLEIALASGSQATGTGFRPRRPGTRRDHHRWSEGARFYLASRFNEPVRLDAVAAAVGCSPFHLTRIFRDEVGMPMHRYLVRLRLKAALLRLAEGERDLTRLGLDTGFSGHSHFTTAFRRETGFTPSSYRRALRTCAPREIGKILKA